MKRATTVGLSLFVVLPLASCTSFSFPGSRGQGAAPARLKDQSAMVKVPGGQFLMGYHQGEPDEYPVHEVELAGFLLDRTEVTNADYDECVAADVCKPTPHANDPVLGGGRHPVVGVSWFDAKKYCAWVGKRLPTEAEWEYAARTPEFMPYPWKGAYNSTAVNARGEVDGYAKTAPVGSFPDGASGVGLLDMAGNASEWVADWYDAVYYQTSPGRSPKGPELSTGARSVRGGSWADSEYSMRAHKRDSLDPNFLKDSIGFRCAAGGS